MPYHYPDRNTYARSVRAEQKRIDRFHASEQRYRDSFNKSSNQFLNAKPSDFNKYAKLAKVGITLGGFRAGVIGLIVFFMLCLTLFSFASDTNQVFTFNSLLSAIRDIPQVELSEFRVSDDIIKLSDKAFDFLIKSANDLLKYKLPNRVGVLDISGIAQFINGSISSVVQPIVNSLQTWKEFSSKILNTFLLPVDFLLYIVSSFMNLLTFIAFFVSRFFFVPIIS